MKLLNLKFNAPTQKLDIGKPTKYSLVICAASGEITLIKIVITSNGFFSPKRLAAFTFVAS